MDKDRRLYARFALDFPDSPKIAPLSDAAFRALVEMTCHSRRMLDDGFIDERIATRKWKKKVIDELCSNDPVRPSLIRVDGGFQLHDFAEHQQTRADIEKKRSAGRAGGMARAQAHAQAPAIADAQASSKLLTETETETTTSNEVVERPRKRGSRLPDGWNPSPETVATMSRECPTVDLRSEHSVFTDYWVAQPGQKGVKTDWDATWRNWMRRKAGDIAARRVKPSKDEQIVGVLEMGRRMQEADDRKAVGA